MTVPGKGRKTIAIVITLVLSLCLNFSSTVSSAPLIDEEDGVWYDTFEDESGLYRLNNCNISKGDVILDSGENNFIYDYSKNAYKDNIRGWSIKDVFFLESISEYASPNFLQRRASNFSSVDYSNLAMKDNRRIVTESLIEYYLNYTFFPMHLFRFTIDEDIDIIERFMISWWFGSYEDSANLEKIELYIWSYSFETIPHWVSVSEIPYDSNELGSEYGDLSYETSNTDFISDEGFIDFLIIATPEESGTLPAKLITDYTMVNITTTRGYKTEGYTISNSIQPSILRRWESIVWESSKESNITSVKIQVLREDFSVINDSVVPGNSEGFIYPSVNSIDLTAVSPSIDIIRLKASFTTANSAITPRLFWWAVTWQTEKNRYRDNFYTDVRIDESVGINIDAGEITISTSSIDWSIFGSDPANTRSFEGAGPETISANPYYWYTKEEIVGGGFRSPVVNEGVAYVASTDNKIYAFDATTSGKNKTHLDSSASKYVVDSSLAVADDVVLVATCELNIPNKIYALNKSSLEEEKWSYPVTDTASSICFSSAPTVANGKVFVTSWNGRSWDTPLQTFLYSLVEGNNKLFALDLTTGDTVWPPVDLPAGSFSTPAVANGLVFVGCKNMYGDSLFAINEETGRIVWNTSVGVIGLSSPVYYNDKVFVYTREVDLLSLQGVDKLIALDAQTGTEIWNTTIETNASLFSNLPLGFKQYYLVAGAAPVATPAVHTESGTIFVMSVNGMLYALDTTNGNVTWTFDASYNQPWPYSPYYCSSPTIADDTLYIATGNGTIHALGVNGAEKWRYQIERPGQYISPPATNIFSSPIVTDGLLTVSVTEKTDPLTGRLYSIGTYTVNSKGSLTSIPIYVPKHYWWENFSATFNTSLGGNIVFSILDKDSNKFVTNLNGSDNDVSNSEKVNSRAIRLHADFSRTNPSDNPILQMWEINWIKENDPPIFDNKTFTPTPGGWINTNTPTCSLQVNDTHSGLDVASGRFRIEYMSTGNQLVTSERFKAESSSSNNGTRNKVTLTADISQTGIIDTISELKTITFFMSDLAGNEGSFTQPFKIDINYPTSTIVAPTTTTTSTYNEQPISITANATDVGSGVQSIALYYNHPVNGWTQYTTDPYEKANNNWSWWFELNENEYVSGIYEFYSVAADNAGNSEPMKAVGDISFILDTVLPDSPLTEDIYYLNATQEFTVEFTDDFRLKTVEYRLSQRDSDNWIPINTADINEEIYVGTIHISSEDWERIEEGEEYTIFFRLTDAAGNQYTTFTAEAPTIIKDITPPVIRLEIPDKSDIHLDDMYTISASIDDITFVTNVTLYYRYETWDTDEWKQYGGNQTIPPFKWQFTATEGSGSYKFKTIAVDAAGNIGEETLSVNLVLFPLIPLAIFFILVIILVVVSYSVIIKLKKV